MAQENAYVLYLDGKKVSDTIAADRPSEPLRLGFTLSGRDGTMTISGIRGYAQPVAGAVPPRGRAIYEARLDGAAPDVRPRTFGGSSQATDLRVMPGAIELVKSLDEPIAFSQAQFNIPSRLTYVAELELAFARGSKSRVELVFRAVEGLRYALAIQADTETLAINFSDARATQQLGTAAPIEDLAAGRRVTIAIVVEETRYTVYVDGWGALLVNDDRVTRMSVPAIQISRGVGSARIYGARFYELP